MTTKTAANPCPQLFQEWWLDPLSEPLGTEMYRYASNGVRGLASVCDGRLDVLAVHSEEEGKGHLRTFVAGCKRWFRKVAFLHVENLMLREALGRYGFKPGFIMDQGEQIPVMKWRRR